MEKIKYKDPFVGEIELTEVGESSKHLHGEDIVRTVYEDKFGNYYINLWSTFGTMDATMTFVHKDAVKIIVEIENQKKDV